MKYQKYYGYLRQKLSARLDFYSRFLSAFFLCFFLNFFAKGLPSFHPSTTVVRSRNSSENGFLSLQYAELESKSSRGVDTTTLWQTKCKVLLLSKRQFKTNDLLLVLFFVHLKGRTYLALRWKLFWENENINVVHTLV